MVKEFLFTIIRIDLKESGKTTLKMEKENVYSNGDIYEGGWVLDKKEGYGKLSIIINGIEYVGNFKSDQFHGEGLYKNAIGDYMKEVG